MHKKYEVFEENGEFFFIGDYGNKFGPYLNCEVAEIASCEAEACGN